MQCCLQGEWEKVAILNLVYKNMGHTERSIWSQEHMSGFVERLLGSWREREFRKQNQMTYNIFIILCQIWDQI